MAIFWHSYCFLLAEAYYFFIQIRYEVLDGYDINRENKTLFVSSGNDFWIGDGNRRYGQCNGCDTCVGR